MSPGSPNTAVSSGEPKRLKWLLSSLESGRREVNDTDSFEGGALSIGGEHIGWQGEWKLQNPRYVSREFFRSMTTGRIQKDDVLLVKDGATIGKVAIAERLPAPEAAVNEHVFLLRFSRTNSAKFYFYFVQSTLGQDQIQLEVRGSAQPGLNTEFRSTVVAPHPSFHQQALIADFLDRQTARLDTLVGKKRKLIEKLKEKRTALISRTVTKGLPAEAAAKAGLNPHPKLKSSGLEWLGDIPEHWEIKRLKHLGSVVSGFAFDSGDFTSSGVRVLKIANVQTLRLDWSDDSYLPEEFYKDYPMFAVGDGDVVFALTRPIISTGLKAAIAAIGKEPVLLNQRNALFKTFRGVSRNFFYHAIFSIGFRAAFEIQINFTGQQPNISPLDIGNIKVAFPPFQEQRAIADYLDRETAKLDRMMERVEAAIEKLQEYRTALITAAVTGKIDVRGAGHSSGSTAPAAASTVAT